jgi:predicted Fe-Mo cluster-binding NifX family protein
MIVAIPLNAKEGVYHNNPCSCTMFSMYEVSGNRKDIRYRHIETKLNPWQKYSGNMVNDPKMMSCECESMLAKDPYHISEHYALLEVIGKCNTLIVDQYCLNTLYAMKNVGIKLHKVPPFVKTTEEALNHFIIGAEIADHLRFIHPAS